MTTVTLEIRDYMTMRAMSVDISQSVYEAAQKMIQNEIGCVVVTKGGDVAGIVTKGDIIKKSLLNLEDPKAVNVASVMSKPVICIGPDKALEEAARLMGENNVSKLPVITNDGVLIGIITSTDIIRIEPGYVKYLKDLIESKSAASAKNKTGS
jgi:CBS domain-containing protein